MEFRIQKDIMTEEQRDKLIIETANDVRWIKAWTVEHKQIHAKYVWYFVSVVIGLFASWFR